MTDTNCAGLTRRSVLRSCAALGFAAVVQRTASSRAIPSRSFELTSLPLPDLSLNRPAPAVAPEEATAIDFDTFGNYWALTRSGKLLVLPAQAPSRWIVDTQSNLPAGEWHSLAADEFGFLWIASSRRLLRLDPHSPGAGWVDFSGTPEIAKACSAWNIGALGIGPAGACVVAFDHGLLCEIDRETTTLVRTLSGPAGIDLIGSDADGNLWLRAGGKHYRRPATADAWQRTWQSAGRLPAGNHDLSGDLLPNGNFVMAGGQTAGFGYPAVRHTFDEVLELDCKSDRWRVAGRLAQARFYNATAVLGGRVWVIGGNRRDPAPAADPNGMGEAHFLASVELCDPATGVAEPGPALPFPMEMPVALQIHGRIYVAGGVKPGLTTGLAPHTYDLPGKLLSIGEGEDRWRSEPDGPPGMGPLAAAAHAATLYVVVAAQGLFLYDTLQRRWSQPLHPCPIVDGRKMFPRSPQVAFFRDELWVMGGRDVPNDGSFIFSPATGAWRAGPKLPRELAWGAGAVVGGRLMIAGGAGGRGYSNRTFLLR